jgi:hypothetical protein
MAIKPVTVAPWVAEILQCRDDHPDWSEAQIAAACKGFASATAVRDVLYFHRPLDRTIPNDDPLMQRWVALLPCELSAAHKEVLELMLELGRKHVRSRRIAGLVNDLADRGLAVGRLNPRPQRSRGWTYTITPAGRAWLEGCQRVEAGVAT